MLPWWLAEAAGKANGWGRRSNPALRRRSEAGEGIPGASPSRRGSGKPHAGAQPLGDPVRERAQRSGPAGAERTRSEERRVGKECVIRVGLGGRRIIKKIM